MAIPTTSVAYSGGGPAKTGQIVVQGDLRGSAAKMLPFTGTAVLDGTLTVFNFNYIDGTQTIPSPKGIVCSSSGGTAANTVSVLSCVTHNASTGQDDYMTVKISGADTNLNTLTVAGFILF
jgi:hypothetical protein